MDCGSSVCWRGGMPLPLILCRFKRDGTPNETLLGD